MGSTRPSSAVAGPLRWTVPVARRCTRSSPAACACRSAPLHRRARIGASGWNARLAAGSAHSGGRPLALQLTPHFIDKNNDRHSGHTKQWTSSSRCRPSCAWSKPARSRRRLFPGVAQAHGHAPGATTRAASRHEAAQPHDAARHGRAPVGAVMVEVTLVRPRQREVRRRAGRERHVRPIDRTQRHDETQARVASLLRTTDHSHRTIGGCDAAMSRWLGPVHFQLRPTIDHAAHHQPRTVERRLRVESYGDLTVRAGATVEQTAVLQRPTKLHARGRRDTRPDRARQRHAHPPRPSRRRR